MLIRSGLDVSILKWGLTSLRLLYELVQHIGDYNYNYNYEVAALRDGYG